VNDLMKYALHLAGKGWHVFPVAPDSKVPAVKEWEQRATTDPDRIRRCWSTAPYNIGIACGPSGLVVIDLDKPKPGQQPPPGWDIEGIRDGYDAFALVCEQAGQPMPVCTYTVMTGRCGTHLYFRHPEGEQLRNTSGTKGSGLGWLIDTRAHGGYVLAEGSRVNGLDYDLHFDDDVAELPGWLAVRLRPARLPEQAAVTLAVSDDRAGRYLQAAIDAELRRVTSAPGGERNTSLFHAATALGQLVAGGSVGQTEIEGLLTQAAHSVGQKPAETAKTIASGLRAGARRPRKVHA
jgi:hypothetical protein